MKPWYYRFWACLYMPFIGYTYMGKGVFFLRKAIYKRDGCMYLNTSSPSARVHHIYWSKR